MTVREKSKTEDFGFKFYYEGKYIIEDDIVVINYISIYLLNDPDISYVSKEDLDQIEVEDTFSERYRIRDKFDELSYICPPNAQCIGELIYERID
ncbi:hypothetical protein AAGF08_12635 [Algoriphagus sp. SE2]|uniref:hypothetical protein n=1 Tax=Algoriphagus sp. SE2 TaxID=3141536 RepID=UPI0031CD94F7